MGQTLDYFCKGIEFTQSHRPEPIPGFLQVLTVKIAKYQNQAARVITGKTYNNRWLELSKKGKNT